MKYYQCYLENENENKTQTSWIPEKYAKVHKILRIGEEDGWRVLQVHGTPIDEKNAIAQAYLHMTYKKVTDI